MEVRPAAVIGDASTVASNASASLCCSEPSWKMSETVVTPPDTVTSIEPSPTSTTLALTYSDVSVALMLVSTATISLNAAPRNSS